MEKLVTSSFRLGIVSGGQLGRMLALKAAEWDIKTYCLDKDSEAPARIICDEFQLGEMTSYDDVVSFGQKVDVLTVESDHVNADALEALEQQGKKVYPSSKTLRIIQDKALQRQFCHDQNLPVPRFEVFASKNDILDSGWEYPFIAKMCQFGYDGKGVFLIQTPEDIQQLPEGKILVEERVKISKELTAIAVRNAEDEVTAFPVSELLVDPDSYIVDYLISPAKIEDQTAVKVQGIAMALIRAFKIEGILAVEIFLDDEGRLWINECSPRPHNSGHHTIEASMSSQYEQHLRGILNMPLGSCESTCHSAMINLLGEDEATGYVAYEGLTEALKIKGVNLHIYGKSKVSPKRKMGHMTVLSHSHEELHETIQQIKEKVRVKGCQTA